MLNHIRRLAHNLLDFRLETQCLTSLITTSNQRSIPKRIGAGEQLMHTAIIYRRLTEGNPPFHKVLGNLKATTVANHDGTVEQSTTMLQSHLHIIASPLWSGLFSCMAVPFIQQQFLTSHFNVLSLKISIPVSAWNPCRRSFY